MTMGLNRGSGDPTMVGPQAQISLVYNVLHTHTSVQVELVSDKNMFMSCYSSFDSDIVDGVLSV
jgi:hypothetical protein